MQRKRLCGPQLPTDWEDKAVNFFTSLSCDVKRDDAIKLYTAYVNSRTAALPLAPCLLTATRRRGFVALSQPARSWWGVAIRNAFPFTAFIWHVAQCPPRQATPYSDRNRGAGLAVYPLGAQGVCQQQAEVGGDKSWRLRRLS